MPSPSLVSLSAETIIELVDEPALHLDQPLLSLVALEGKRILARQVAYSDWLERRPGVTAMGVRGLTLCDNHYLLGLRGPSVSLHAGEWECAPGGSLPGPDYRQQLFEELEEETGIPRDEVEELELYAAVWNPFYPVVDLCCLIICREGVRNRTLSARDNEYTNWAWRPLEHGMEGGVPTTQTIIRAGTEHWLKRSQFY